MKYVSTITFALVVISSLGSTGQAFEFKVPESVTLGTEATVEWIGQPTLSTDQSVVLFDSAGAPLLTLCEGQINGSGKCSFTISQVDLPNKTVAKAGEKSTEKYRLGFRAKNDGLTLDYSKDFDILASGSIQKEGVSDDGKQDSLESDDGLDEDDDEDDENEDKDEDEDEDEGKDVEENKEKDVQANGLDEKKDGEKNKEDEDKDEDKEGEDEDDDEDDEDDDDENEENEENDAKNAETNAQERPIQKGSRGKKPMEMDIKKQIDIKVDPEASKQTEDRNIKLKELNVKIEQVQQKVQEIMNKLSVKATIKVGPNESQKATKEA